MQDFVLPTAANERVQLSQYRGRKNLVLIFAGDKKHELLRGLAARMNELREEQAQVLVVIARGPADAARFAGALPFPVLADRDGAVHVRFGAMPGGVLAPALFVTDRFGEVFAAFRTAEGHNLPGAAEVLDWLRFVNQQCEECNPPEWPA